MDQQSGGGRVGHGRAIFRTSRPAQVRDALASPIRDATVRPVTPRLVCHLVHLILLLAAALPVAAQAQADGPKRIAQGYLYLEPYQARFECLLDLRTVLDWLDIPGTRDGALPADTAAAVLAKTATQAATWCAFRAGDSDAESRLAITQFVQGEPGRTLPMPAGGAVSVNGTMLGLMWECPLGAEPQTVQVAWQGFIPPIERLPVTLFFGREKETATLTASDPAHRWHNNGRLPRPKPLATVPPPPERATFPLPLGALAWTAVCLLAAALLLRKHPERERRHPEPERPRSEPERPRSEERECPHSQPNPPAPKNRLLRLALLALIWLPGVYLTAPLLSPRIPRPGASGQPKIQDKTQAEQIVAPLLRNVYRAFDHRRESDIYDVLERSADGPLLKKLYLDIIAALSLDEAEAARVHVAEFAAEVQEVLPAAENGNRNAFTAKTSWTALGSVGHWGHSHTRTNVCLGEVTVEPVRGEWKITRIEMLDQRRL